MVQPKQLNPDESPQAFYGAELRRVREEAGFSQDRLGERVFCSGSYIGQMEATMRRPQLDLSQRVDAVLETGGYFERLCRMVLRATKHAPYFADAAELERLAKTICEYAPSIVPGLLQTEEYVRALSIGGNPFVAREEVERYVQARLDRKQLLDGPDGPKFWAILHEAVLRTEVGGTATMGAQLVWISQLMRTRRILLQVIPFSAGAHPAIGGMVSLMTFDDAPPAAYIEGPHAGQLLDDPALVARCQSTYDLARAVALPPAASLALVDAVAEEYADHEHSARPSHGPVA